MKVNIVITQINKKVNNYKVYRKKRMADQKIKSDQISINFQKCYINPLL